MSPINKNIENMNVIRNLVLAATIAAFCSCTVKQNEVTVIEGSNPISPMGVYIADPTARVWEDGKMYIYGSRDESLDYYCSKIYAASEGSGSMASG